VRPPLFSADARRKTVSITLNGDLVAKATAAGINISHTAEEALARAYEAWERDRVRQELREAARMVDEYVALHGMPFEYWANESSADADHAA
jgi:post-segregation antitoxin (ccd killing protein)